MTTTRKEIALTFDDGPWYQTPQFLSLLERYELPATFFEVGEHIAQFGEGGAIERRMLRRRRHDRRSHLESHRRRGRRSGGRVPDRADGGREPGSHPWLYAMPVPRTDGDVSPALLDEARSLRYTTIQWDIDPRDWALPGVGEIEGNVLANAHPGAIVIMHDGGGDRSQTLAALPSIIDTLRARGYTFVTVTQLLGLHLTYG